MIDLSNYHLGRFDDQYLPQQAYIFSGSILENLTLGAKQAIAQEGIINACDMAEIREDIEQMPMGYLMGQDCLVDKNRESH